MLAAFLQIICTCDTAAIESNSHLGRMMADLRLPTVDRRGLLLGGLVAAGGAAALVAQQALAQEHSGHTMTAQAHRSAAAADPYTTSAHLGGHGDMMTVGEVDNARNGFDPIGDADRLGHRDGVDRCRTGGRCGPSRSTAIDKEIEIAPGVFFPAWTYNGRVPGPTLRANEGDRLRFIFRNFGSHPHSMHFHGIHSARMDGVPGAGLIDPGEEFVYEFDAKPFGCHLYHCHALPLKRHIHKGMYGAFIIDPDPARHPEAAEVARVAAARHAGECALAGVRDGDERLRHQLRRRQRVLRGQHGRRTPTPSTPIRIEKSRPVRIYLVNVTEFDPINSFHLHANFFDYYDTGTHADADAEDRRPHHAVPGAARHPRVHLRRARAGPYMFHAHQSEFTELGWMGMFDVVEA